MSQSQSIAVKFAHMSALEGQRMFWQADGTWHTCDVAILQQPP